jgi:predicted DNA-binding transcriptional regulator
LLVQNGVIVDLVQNWYNVYLVQMWYNEPLGGFIMAEWKTMREVAQELGVSKRVIKYHKEKLGLFEATLENGVIKISPQGVEKIKGFVRPKEYTQNFETEVLQRLEAIEERLVTDDFDKRDPKEVIRSFWQYLIATPNAAEILEELVGDVVTLEPEQDFYRETARLVNLENGISELPLFGDGSDIFDSDWP